MSVAAEWQDEKERKGSPNFKIVRSQGVRCGAVVNPLHLKIRSKEHHAGSRWGHVRSNSIQQRQDPNPKFSLYRVPRFRDAPPIEVVLVDRKDIPSAGAGETPIVGLAPAVGNAIFNAAKVRLRSLPLLPQQV